MPPTLSRSHSTEKRITYFPIKGVEWATLLGDEETMRTVRAAMINLVEHFDDWHLGEEPRLRPVW